MHIRYKMKLDMYIHPYFKKLTTKMMPISNFCMVKKRNRKSKYA